MKNKEIDKLKTLFNLISEVKNFVINKLIENNTINEIGFSTLLKNNFFETEKLKINLPNDIYRDAITYFQSIADYYNNRFVPEMLALKNAKNKSHQNIDKYEKDVNNPYINFVKFTKQKTSEITKVIKKYLEDQGYYQDNIEEIEEIFEIFTNIKKFFNINFIYNETLDIVGLEEILKKSFIKIESLELLLSDDIYIRAVDIIKTITDNFNEKIAPKIKDYQEKVIDIEKLKQTITIPLKDFITETNKSIAEFTNYIDKQLYGYDINFSNTNKYYNINKQKLETSLDTENIEDFCRLLKSYFASIPYLIQKEKLKEGYFHSIFHIIMEIYNFDIKSEEATNQGRMDSVIKLNNKIFIFEFKLTENNDAIQQITNNKYFEKFEHENLPIYGISINCNSQKRNIENCKIVKIR